MERSLWEGPLFGVDVPVPSIQPAAVFEDAGMTGNKALGTLPCKTIEGL